MQCFSLASLSLLTFRLDSQGTTFNSCKLRFSKVARSCIYIVRKTYVGIFSSKLLMAVTLTVDH